MLFNGTGTVASRECILFDTVSERRFPRSFGVFPPLSGRSSFHPLMGFALHSDVQQQLKQQQRRQRNAGQTSRTGRPDGVVINRVRCFRYCADAPVRIAFRRRWVIVMCVCVSVMKLPRRCCRCRRRLRRSHPPQLSDPVYSAKGALSEGTQSRRFCDQKLQFGAARALRASSFDGVRPAKSFN